MVLHLYYCALILFFFLFFPGMNGYAGGYNAAFPPTTSPDQFSASEKMRAFFTPHSQAGGFYSSFDTAALSKLETAAALRATEIPTTSPYAAYAPHGITTTSAFGAVPPAAHTHSTAATAGLYSQYMLPPAYMAAQDVHRPLYMFPGALKAEDHYRAHIPGAVV